MTVNLLKTKIFFRIAAILVLLTTGIIGCKTNEELVPVTVESSQKVNVDSLKVYMSKVVNVKVGDIYYNEQTKMFSMFGIDQIERGKLTEFYEIAKKK